jgi:hypothetical protein
MTASSRISRTLPQAPSITARSVRDRQASVAVEAVPVGQTRARMQRRIYRCIRCKGRKPNPDQWLDTQHGGCTRTGGVVQGRRAPIRSTAMPLNTPRRAVHRRFFRCIRCTGRKALPDQWVDAQHRGCTAAGRVLGPIGAARGRTGLILAEARMQGAWRRHPYRWRRRAPRVASFGPTSVQGRSK